jgi:hypothetical protein
MIRGRVQLIFLMLATFYAPAYSVLSAFIGEIEAARPAGIIAAKNAQTASALAATPNATGSQNETP